MPLNTELKDVYFTQGRSQIVKNTTDRHPEHRHIVVDGRLRSAPPSDDTIRECSLFFAATRTDKVGYVNMEVRYPPSSIAVTVDMSSKGFPRKHATQRSVDNCPQLPYMVNTVAIPKHTRLLVLDDQELGKLSQKAKDDKMLALGKGCAEAVLDFKRKQAATDKEKEKHGGKAQKKK